MLTGYVLCIPLKTKTAMEVVQDYIDNMYAKFGGSLQILSGNGTEFKNQIFEHVAKELGVKYKKYTPPYCPTSNGQIEGFHNFLKSCISKHISSRFEWMAVAPLACAAYNFIPNEHSCESPFFLMFGRDPVLPLNSILAPSYRYLDNDANMLSLESLKNMYQIAAENLHEAQLKKLSHSAAQLARTLQEGDLVLTKNHKAGTFELKYVNLSRVICLHGNQVELVPATGGRSRMEHRKHVKYILSVERFISELPEYEKFGRKSKLRLDPVAISNLKWEWTEDRNMEGIGMTSGVKHMYEFAANPQVKTILVNTRRNSAHLQDICVVTTMSSTVVSSKIDMSVTQEKWHCK